MMNVCADKTCLNTQHFFFLINWSFLGDGSEGILVSYGFVVKGRTAFSHI